MKEQTQFDIIWDLICAEDREIPLVVMKLGECWEPKVDNYDKMKTEGPFEVHLYHAYLSFDHYSVVQALIICKQ